MSSADEDTKAKRIKCSLSILEWLQGYFIYVAAISLKFLNCIPNLMGYQSLIIEAHLECKNDCWIGYDCRFRQQAASQPDRPWAAVEPTLWNHAFAGQAKSSRCKHCFSLSHQSAECVSCPPNPYQRHVKTLNVASFASTGMRLQGPHVLILMQIPSYLLHMCPQPSNYQCISQGNPLSTTGPPVTNQAIPPS